MGRRIVMYCTHASLSTSTVPGRTASASDGTRTVKSSSTEPTPGVHSERPRQHRRRIARRVLGAAIAAAVVASPSPASAGRGASARVGAARAGGPGAGSARAGGAPGRWRRRSSPRGPAASRTGCHGESSGRTVARNGPSLHLQLADCRHRAPGSADECATVAVPLRRAGLLVKSARRRPCAEGGSRRPPPRRAAPSGEAQRVGLAVASSSSSHDRAARRARRRARR